MSEREQKLCVGKMPLHQIRNRNEARLAQIMPSLFAKLNLELDSIDIQDVFALALNKLPPHYVREMAIVFVELVDEDTIRVALREAIAQVQASPNH